MMLKKTLILTVMGIVTVAMATSNSTNYVRGNGMATSSGQKGEFKFSFYDFHNLSGTTGKGQFRLRWKTGTRQFQEIILGIPGKDVMANMTISGNTATLSGTGALRTINNYQGSTDFGTVSVSITDSSTDTISVTYTPDNPGATTTFSGNVTHGDIKVGTFDLGRP